jgi:nucleoside-diphosphate kinase
MSKKDHSLKQERTFVLIKPDAVKRGLVGEIVARIEQRGLKIIAIDMITATDEMIDNHYPKDKKWITRIGNKTLGTYEKYEIDVKEELGTDDPEKIGKLVRSWLMAYMTSGPMVKMVVEGIHAIDMVRKMAGDTFPYKAEMGTIRGDYSVDSPVLANLGKRSVRNIIHASETQEEADNEIALWYDKNDVHSYKRSGDDIMF